MRPVVFDRERLTESFFNEAMPLLVAHWREIAHYQDIPLRPDINAYIAHDCAGILRLYTARIADDGTLVGYACFFVRENPHYLDSKHAVSDVIFLDRGMRGMDGWKFLKYIDAALSSEDVEVVYHHVKLAHDFGPILTRMGYEPVETIYARRVRHGSDSGDDPHGGRADGRREPETPASEGRGRQTPQGHRSPDQSPVGRR